MASSKKYGYKLRGEKLSLVELDITGTGNGLNYTYEENAGLDIATDPSSWKSPLADVDSGLQIEYLSNDLNLEDEFIDAPINTLMDPFTHMSSNGISHWAAWEETNGKLDFLSENFGIEFAPTSLASFSSTTGTGIDGTNTNLLKITKYAGESATGGPSELNNNLRQWIHTGSFPVEIGHRYRMSIDIKTDYVCYGIDPTIHLLLLGDSPFNDFNQPLGETGESLNIFDHALSHFETSVKNPVNLIPSSSSELPWFMVKHIFDSHGVAGSATPGESPNLLNGQWKTCSFDFTAVSDTVRLGMQIPLTTNSTDGIYLDNFMISQFDNPLQPKIEKNIILPSYAQKALLDYVRSQDAYENGDLEKWDFFMKQFRSKLERWEDSRITGPRVLGPHGPSSIR